ncbi:hypothetical protein ACFU51_28365 [Streptomyces sp. NPDC057430]|uniref:hypothetical protein n=1 Tax=Streptomyces sp. NPDC057430 TaxID=3346131 RepID=UPI0036976CB8
MITQTKQTARARLRTEMERLFADDAGMGVLVKYNGRPDLSDQAKETQTAWSRALVSAHGHDRAASVYTQYAGSRQTTVTEPIGSWNNLVLNTKPLGGWTRDIHGFLCCICGDAFTSVVIDGCDDVCNRCARENSTVEDARPQWHAYSRGAFVFPGLLREEMPRGETAIGIRYADGETREYFTGEAGLLAKETTRLPGFTCISGQTHGESRDTINLTIEARAERQRRSVDILATFTYDPQPEVHEPHPYGFRFVSARLATRYRPLGQLELADPTVTEHTDLYRMLDVLITHLYGGQK